MLEILQTINDNINSSIAVTFNVNGDEDYKLIDSPTFYNAVDSFNSLIINEDDSNFIDYLDTKIRIGVILVNLKDKPSSGVPASISPYSSDKNTIEIADERYGNPDAIADLYLLNGVNSDYEIKTTGYILIPEVN